MTLVVGLALMGLHASAAASAAQTAAEEPVEIGPGSDDPRPASRNAGQKPGREPAWVARVPAIAEQQPPVDASIQADVLTVGAPAGVASTPQGTDSALPKRGTYEGTTTIDVAYYSRCTRDGTVALAGTRKYRMEAQVVVGAPAEHQGVQERNPFNLNAGSEYGVEASTQITSGTVATDNRDGRGMVVNYWDIDQQGRQIRGVLTNRFPGLNLNSFQTVRPLGDPCSAQSPAMAYLVAIAEGATLSGTVTDTSIKFELLGQTIDTERRFRAAFDVKRVR